MAFNTFGCYVYLLGVLKNDTGKPLRAKWKKELCDKLIAPLCVEFFAQNGQWLRDKTLLEQLIYEITRVSINALRGSPLFNFSIDGRMSWPNGCKINKAEDKTYSRLRIFNGKAFNRLRIEIDQKSGIRRVMSEKASMLNRIPIAMSASFDSHAEEYNPTCLPGIRIGVEDPNVKAVFWLNGMAGTGKSTILRTLLVQRKQALTQHIKDVINKYPTIFDKALLILEPLSKSHLCHRDNSVVIIVIDALDEYNEDEDIKTIVQLFSNANASQPPLLRVFLTSRLELLIDEHLIRYDLFVYFEHELGKIKAEYNTSIAIILSYTLANANPCGSFHGSFHLRFDCMPLYSRSNYSLVCLLTRRKKYWICSDMSSALSSFLKLLDIPEGTIDTLLDSLDSVLNIPSSPKSPVRLLHLSFREFVIDSLNRGKHRFWVHRKTTHRYLSKHCLRILDKAFRPGARKVPQPHNEILNKRRIPTLAELYAWMYRIYHVQQSEDGIVDDQSYRFLKVILHNWSWTSTIACNCTGASDMIKLLGEFDPCRILSSYKSCYPTSNSIDSVTDSYNTSLGLLRGTTQFEKRSDSSNRTLHPGDLI
ncbi:hypothetical protein RRF57_003450 [Xylaria bambusicola]|uniref:Nephrocystin 3-like N-terminal domain-containing protein n=1 Tax=Xylaria bambusicola TaxID=326684 RepID=A0AAN7U867_9PEZI